MEEVINRAQMVMIVAYRVMALMMMAGVWAVTDGQKMVEVAGRLVGYDDGGE